MKKQKRKNNQKKARKSCFEKKFKKKNRLSFFLLHSVLFLSLSLSLAHIKNNIVNKKKSI